MKEIKITEANAQEALRQAENNPELQGILRSLFGEAVEPEQPKDITERVKTYEDACKVLGYEVELHENTPYDVVAYCKLRVIAEALNEGWLPQITKDEYRYYPWFYLYTQEDIDDMDEDSKKDLVLLGGYASDGSVAGFACSYSDYAPSGTGADVGSRLCFKTRELALYCGKQFADIWAYFCLVRK